MKLAITMFVVLMLNGCNSSKDSSPAPSTSSSSEDIEVEIEGVVQKGPFIAGADVSIYELDSKMYQTGKNFFTNTKNNKGKFLAKGKLAKNTYFEIVTNGYFFDEVSGQLSDGPITLKVISDVNEESATNVNILTHIQSARMKVLMADGKNYDEAQTQAANEVLDVFNVNLTITDFKSLDLTQNSLANAALLYVSGVMMNLAHRNATGSVEAELVESLTNITEDLSSDGDIDSSTYSDRIADAIRTLDTGAIELNLKQRLTDIGEDPSTVPSLEPLTSNPWTTIATLAEGPSGIECLDGYCYLLGTFSTFRRINVSTGVVETLTDLPFSHGFGYLKVVKVGTDLYVPRYVGGSPNQLWKYSTTSETWTQLTSSQFQHQHAMSAIHVSGKIYLLADNGTVNCEAYSIQDDSWVTIASNSIQRTYPNSFSYNNKIYLFGGTSSEVTTQNVEVYDIDGDSWSQVTPSQNLNSSGLIAFSGQTATVVIGDSMGDANSIYRWNVQTNIWTNSGYGSEDISSNWSIPLRASEPLDGNAYSFSSNKFIKFFL